MSKPITIKRRLPAGTDAERSPGLQRTVERLARQQRCAWRAVEQAVRSAAWLAKEEQRAGLGR